MLVREKPPLRLGWDITAPNGKHYRWAADEPRPENIPSGVRFSTTMPGGFESADATLPRRPDTTYADLEPFSTLVIYGPGGAVAGEFRLERAPRTSGNQMSVTPSAVGWQAHLEDDKSAKEVYVDRDLQRWGSPSARRRNAALATFGATDAQVAPGADSLPALRTVVPGPWTVAPGRPLSEAWYDANGVVLGSLYYAWTKGPNTNSADANWEWYARLADDDIATSADTTANLRAAGPGSGTLTATAADRKFARVMFFYLNVANAASGVEYNIDWTTLAVFGNHGLTKRGTAPNEGFYASDIVGHAVSAFAPLLNTDIQDSRYIVQQAAYLEPTSPAEIVRDVTRFGLQDWGVWEGKTFRWANRGYHGRSWRARIAPSQLQETGPQVDRIFESVIVQYQDVDGSTRSVGPPGSGANTEDASLVDDDTQNPAVQLGITRRALLTMGVGAVTGRPGADAIEVGTSFLEAQKTLDVSGQASLVGHVADDHGVLHPAWAVRAGDTISFPDASDTGLRRIVKTDYSHDSRTCTIDIDSPPEGLQALLERLGADMARMGL